MYFSPFSDCTLVRRLYSSTRLYLITGAREYDHLSYANRGHSALEKRDYSDLINILWRDVADGIDFSTQQSEKIATTFF